MIDTNILVAGLRSKRGASYQVLSLLGSRRFTPVITVPLLMEYEKTLREPRLKIPFSRDEIGGFLDYFCSVSHCQIIHYLWRPTLSDPKDDMVLEAAANGDCPLIVTYNGGDFRGSARFGVEIVKPRDFLKK
ncbi:MAG: putative toxin-antitoxin system toxin component, PIN family [Verrucomicrobiae bacterium]|nr:putative toxin-antitoxin system toxin component, PIN family [Verrucomicrobiae bacterium]